MEKSIFKRILTFASTLSSVSKSILKLEGEILPGILKTKLLYWRQCLGGGCFLSLILSRLGRKSRDDLSPVPRQHTACHFGDTSCRMHRRVSSGHICCEVRLSFCRRIIFCRSRETQASGNYLRLILEFIGRNVPLTDQLLCDKPNSR